MKTQLMQQYAEPKKTLVKMSHEELIAKKDDLDELQLELDAVKNTVKAELLKRALKTPKGKIEVGNRTISVVTRFIWSQVPLKFALKYKATKLVADSQELEKLYQRGIKIPNMEVTRYPFVSKPNR